MCKHLNTHNLRPCAARRAAGARGTIKWDSNVTYQIPAHHQPADEQVALVISELLRQPGVASFLSVNDFGAGVGQYGEALERLDKRHRWRGYDGAGNVEEWTNGMVRWFDLTVPLSLPRADWVLSLEVGEHIPSMHEAMLFRNLHLHNCRGVVLSWAVPGAPASCRVGLGAHRARCLLTVKLPEHAPVINPGHP